LHINKSAQWRIKRKFKIKFPIQIFAIVEKKDTISRYFCFEIEIQLEK